MTTSRYDAMHDFLSDLERGLAAEAARAPRVAARRATRVVAPLVAAAVVVAVALVVLPARTPTPAYGKPKLLAVPPTGVPAALRGGLALELAAGPDARLDAARPIAAAPGAYLLSGDDAWCLSAPDPAAAQPDVERAVSCVRTAELLRIGVSVRVGATFLAAVPDGVEDPVLRRADGTRTVLEPDEHGVVAATTLAPGDTITRHGTDGSTRVDRASR